MQGAMASRSGISVKCNMNAKLDVWVPVARMPAFDHGHETRWKDAHEMMSKWPYNKKAGIGLV